MRFENFLMFKWAYIISFRKIVFSSSSLHRNASRSDKDSSEGKTWIRMKSKMKFKTGKGNFIAFSGGDYVSDVMWCLLKIYVWYWNSHKKTQSYLKKKLILIWTSGMQKRIGNQKKNFFFNFRSRTFPLCSGICAIFCLNIFKLVFLRICFIKSCW
jgi:hypothetical protein